MWMFKHEKSLKIYLNRKKTKKQVIGFVPTMGALHQGHISLIEACNKKSDRTVCSIFVNPTQFNDKKDLEKYPRTLEKDVQMLFDGGCHVVFLPTVTEIYPTPPTQHYDLGELEQIFEGSSRPGHFQGVCQVVDRLFEIVQPDKVFFGQKDYQQCMVINRLLALVPNFSKITMKIVPTQREASGLAMSSRNLRLSAEQRTTAAQLYQTLLFLKTKLHPGQLSNLLEQSKKHLFDAGFRCDYISIAHAATLEPVQNWDGKIPLVALVAAFLGEVRLIDNLLLTD